MTPVLDYANDIHITVNGFPLTGINDGVEWHVTLSDVTGLYDGLGTSLASTQRVLADGVFYNKPFYGERQISITGHIFGGCWNSILSSWEHFKAKLLKGVQPFTASLMGVTRVCDVYQGSTAPVILPLGAQMAKFTVKLACASPFLYGGDIYTAETGLPSSGGGRTYPYIFDTERGAAANVWCWPETVTSGAIYINYNGTAETPVQLTISGPVANPTVTHTPSGRVLKFGLTLGAGHTLTVDTGERSIYVDGSPLRGHVLRREFPVLTPNAVNQLQFSADEYSQDARLHVRWREAYL